MRNTSLTTGNHALIRGLDANGHLQGSIGFLYGDHSQMAQADIFIEPRIVASPSAFVVKSAGDVVMNGGKVIIGTPTGTETNKLSVHGTISAMEVKVTTTGADYVFPDGYHLRPLAEVEQYVIREKHLPDIAPAKEMQDSGMPLSEVVTKQLAKIEELTLYAIALDKDKTELKGQVDGQRQQIKQLQDRLDRLEQAVSKMEKAEK